MNSNIISQENGMVQVQKIYEELMSKNSDSTFPQPFQPIIVIQNFYNCQPSGIPMGDEINEVIEIGDEETIPTFVFRKQGDCWQIGPKGHEQPFKHLKGYGQIQYLLRQPNKDVHCMEVYHQGTFLVEDKLYLDNYTHTGRLSSCHQILDITARENYEKRLCILNEKLENLLDNIPEERILQMEAIWSEIQWLEYELLQWKFHSPEEEKARSTVTKVIKKAADKIYKKSPEMEKYLEIETGYKCKYNQPDNIRWELE